VERPRRIRAEPIAFENWTRPEERGTGSYLIEMQGPDGFYVTDYVSYRLGCVMARRRTQYHQNVKLVGMLEPYDPPALD
jgi:hypothetical protein